MRRCFVFIAVLSLACGSSGPPPASPGPAAGDVISITGLERIGWDQISDSLADLGILRYAIYVDSQRSELADVSCGQASGSSGYTCSGKLPSMSMGTHTLELASFLIDGTESIRSAPIRVTITGLTAEQSAAGWSPEVPESLVEGTALRLEKLATGLDRPVDAAFLPDGRLLIAERAGHVRIVDGGRLAADDSLPTGLADMPDALLSIAVDPLFDETRAVFLVELAPGLGGTVLRIARYTEFRGRFGQRAVIHQTAVAARPATAALRFGPDGNLYLALDGETSTGQLLRLTPDGRTPRDGASALPAIAGGIIRLRGMAWSGSGLLWIAAEQGDEGSISAVALSAPPVRARVVTRHALQDRLGSLAFYTADAIGIMRGDALIASPDASILRVHFDAGDPLRIQRVDRLLDNRVGPIRVVSVGPDGVIYFCTDDALGRLSPGKNP
jgi:glucose/arabinose dehydrogenase